MDIIRTRPVYDQLETNYINVVRWLLVKLTLSESVCPLGFEDLVWLFVSAKFITRQSLEAASSPDLIQKMT